jgi:hypothetical protein
MVHFSREYQIEKSEAEGFERVRKLNGAGHALLLVQDDPGCSDPPVLLRGLLFRSVKCWQWESFC